MDDRGNPLGGAAESYKIARNLLIRIWENQELREKIANKGMGFVDSAAEL